MNGEAVPGALDLATTKQQKQERQDDTPACEEEEHFLPAPKTLTSQDQECSETDIDQQTDDENPPLGGDTQYRKRGQ